MGRGKSREGTSEKLEQVSPEMASLFSALNEGVLIYDRDGRVVQASRKALSAEENLIGMSEAERVKALSPRFPDGTPLRPEQLPSSRALRGETVYREPLLLSVQDGREVFVLASASPIRSGGWVTGAVSVLLNVTELEQEKRKLSAIIDNAPFGILVIDREGRVTMANREAEVLYGRSVPYGEKMEAHLRLDPFYPDGRPYLPQDLPLSLSVFRGEIHQGVEIGVVQPDGEKWTLLVYSSPIFDSKGEIIGAVGSFLDISERKGMEQELHAAKENLEAEVQKRTANLEAEIEKRKKFENALKLSTENVIKQYDRRKYLSRRLVKLLEQDRRDVAATLHDQVGQLLTTLNMDLEAVGEEVKEAALRDKLQSAQEKVREILGYVKDTSRRLRPTTLDTLGLKPSLRALTEEIEEAGGCRVRFFSKGDFSGLDPENALALYRITQEALTNALRHASCHEIFVHLVKRGNVLTLSVEDDGVGFAYDEVLDPKNAGKGSLGIMIMRERASQAGAGFRIESHPGKGTQVMVEMNI